MEEVEKVKKALQLVERYEYYLFRKAWGMTLIIIGICGSISAFLALKAQYIAEILHISAEAFILLASVMIWLVGAVIIVYSFVSAQITLSKEKKGSFRRDMPHAVLISLIWFISFKLTGYAPERFEVVSWLWAGGGSCILSYLIHKIVLGHGNYPELLLVGLTLLVVSLPIAVVGDTSLAETATLVTFAISFVIGGLYSIMTASKILSVSE